MQSLKLLVVVSGAGLAAAGFMLPQRPHSDPQQAERDVTVDPQPRHATVSLADAPVREVAATSRVEKKLPSSGKDPPSEAWLTERVVELEEQVVALQMKYDDLQKILGDRNENVRNGESIADLQSRIQSLETAQKQSQAQIDRFHVNQQGRKLNPTERREAADLVGQRVLAAQSQWLRFVQAQAAQQNFSVRHEEPLYAP